MSYSRNTHNISPHWHREPRKELKETEEEKYMCKEKIPKKLENNIAKDTENWVRCADEHTQNTNNNTTNRLNDGEKRRREIQVFFSIDPVRKTRIWVFLLLNAGLL